MTYKDLVFSDEDIEIEVRGAAHSPLVRLFRWPGSAADEPDPVHRNGRFDPPPGHKDAFALLYTADHVSTAAMECRVLTVDHKDEFTYSYRNAPPYKVTRFKYSKPATFIRIDCVAEKKFGIGRFATGYETYQHAALALYLRYGDAVNGLSWSSYHRGKPGRNYGFWHSRKDTVDLLPTQHEDECALLQEDDEWLEFLNQNPTVVLAA